ncbi:MAG TPA: hypothetical protein VK211_08140 [Kamptonema sp.]|nr:hypothetical protein [Kamptonema sp.]
MPVALVIEEEFAIDGGSFDKSDPSFSTANYFYLRSRVDCAEGIALSF